MKGKKLKKIKKFKKKKAKRQRNNRYQPPPPNHFQRLQLLSCALWFQLVVFGTRQLIRRRNFCSSRWRYSGEKNIAPGEGWYLSRFIVLRVCIWMRWWPSAGLLAGGSCQLRSGVQRSREGSGGNEGRMKIKIPLFFKLNVFKSSESTWKQTLLFASGGEGKGETSHVQKWHWLRSAKLEEGLHAHSRGFEHQSPIFPLGFQ